MAIAIGALQDGILESIVIGVSLIGGGAVSAEAFEQAHNFNGLITVVWFLLAFVLTKLGAQAIWSFQKGCDPELTGL